MTHALDKVLYTATASATNGREGRVSTDDGRIDMKLDPPPALGGKGDGANPEQLFASGYAACFGSALSYQARLKKITTGPVKVTASVSIGPKGEAFLLQVKLSVAIPELPREQAEELVKIAHTVCPYSRATQGNIQVDLEVV